MMLSVDQTSLGDCVSDSWTINGMSDLQLRSRQVILNQTKRIRRGKHHQMEHDYLEDLDHFKSWLYETEPDFASKKSLASLADMRKLCWWLKEDLLMGEYMRDLGI